MKKALWMRLAAISTALASVGISLLLAACSAEARYLAPRHVSYEEGRYQPVQKDEEIWVIPTTPGARGGGAAGRGATAEPPAQPAITSMPLPSTGMPAPTTIPIPANPTTGILNFNGGMLQSSGNSTLGGVINSGSGYMTLNGGTVTTISGAIVENGTLNRVGSGTLTLSGGNTYSGASNVSAGVLNLAGGTLTLGNAGQGAAPGTAGKVDTTEHLIPAIAGGSLPIPGGPVLAARQNDGHLVMVPLKHTDVDASITGYIASVGVTQQFANPYPDKIEAVYVFPLPDDAGVNEFTMTIGTRHIRGIIREREEAKKIYETAKAQGYTASMMTQERPNIFTQNVANIEPGKQIDISIRYFHTLTYQDGWYQWNFPMVVGPRYNPPGTTAGVGAVPVGAGGASGQQTEVQYLRPDERSGHDIGLKVNVDAGVSIEDMESVNHKIVQVAGKTPTQRSIVLSADDKIPNKDFVLRYKVAGDKVKTGMFVQKDKDGKSGWFTLMIVPPAELKSIPRQGVEMVFVVDTSGSMSGQPIDQAKKAVQTALAKMQPGDTFQVVKFAGGAQQMSAAPLLVNEASIAQARNYVATMQGDGPTEMLKGINAALDFPHDENRTRVVAFLTDGFIGNETQILKSLHEKLQESRVFSFGVGSSPNRYLLDSMARLGHGNAAYLPLNQDPEPVMASYFEHISHPALANVKLTFDGMKVSDVYPQRIPELFVGRPIIVTGRFTGDASSKVTINGRAGDQKLSYSLSAADDTQDHPAIATVWARTRVGDLHDESIYEGRDVTTDVRDTALTYGIMSEFTSFIAVDSANKTPGEATTVVVPVPVPDGVRYETTVQNPRRN